MVFLRDGGGVCRGLEEVLGGVLRFSSMNVYRRRCLRGFHVVSFVLFLYFIFIEYGRVWVSGADFNGLWNTISGENQDLNQNTNNENALGINGKIYSFC